MPAPTLGMRSRGDALQEMAFPGCAISESEVSTGSARWHAGMEQTFRLAVPHRGHVLSTAAEFYGNPIREAVGVLSASLARKPHEDIARCMRPLQGADYGSEVCRSDTEMAAWFIAGMWIVGVAGKKIPISASLRGAERWFFGGDPADSLTAIPSADAVATAEKSLREQADTAAYLDLLPYILDPHGPGSRLSVRRDPSTRTARSRKRANGVFYTPADVAEYMAGACLDALGADLPLPVFDPACGTGVFLKAAFVELRRRFPGTDALSLASECLFGADIDPWALDATSFVIVTDIPTDPAATGLPPVALWQRMRRNFARIDALRINPAAQAPSDIQENRSDRGRIPIHRLFPALQDGPAVVLGNPPYADLGARADLSEIGSVFRTIAVKQQPGAEIYLAFIEQMIQLAAPEASAGALVLPLSIACNVGPQFAAARKLIGETRGRWRFAFFDREPHALFGEDVKTRNAIVLWSRAPHDKNTVLATGPLRKWRGDGRSLMFKSLSFTAIGGDIRGGIPKIDGARQAVALETLVTRWSRLERAVQDIGRRSLATAMNANEQTVFVGPTAYNFLNIFLKPCGLPQKYVTSLRASVARHHMCFASRRACSLCAAIKPSRILVVACAW